MADRNKKKQGHRSYYRLYCFDVLNRIGSSHASNGARSCVSACIEAVRTLLPNCNCRGKYGPCVIHSPDVGA
jgi:hypothetical protein